MVDSGEREGKEGGGDQRRVRMRVRQQIMYRRMTMLVTVLMNIYLEGIDSDVFEE